MRRRRTEVSSVWINVAIATPPRRAASTTGMRSTSSEPTISAGRSATRTSRVIPAAEPLS